MDDGRPLSEFETREVEKNRGEFDKESFIFGYEWAFGMLQLYSQREGKSGRLPADIEEAIREEANERMAQAALMAVRQKGLDPHEPTFVLGFMWASAMVLRFTEDAHFCKEHGVPKRIQNISQKIVKELALAACEEVQEKGIVLGTNPLN